MSDDVLLQLRYMITKQFKFEAAHHIDTLPEDHKCKRPHGHSYRVEVVLASDTLDDFGFVEDYGNLDDVKRWLDTNFDHRDLNEILPFPTTAENLAAFLLSTFSRMHPKVIAVRVSETENTWAIARYGRPDSE